MQKFHMVMHADFHLCYMFYVRGILGYRKLSIPALKVSIMGTQTENQNVSWLKADMNAHIIPS